MPCARRWIRARTKKLTAEDAEDRRGEDLTGSTGSTGWAVWSNRITRARCGWDRESCDPRAEGSQAGSLWPRGAGLRLGTGGALGEQAVHLRHRMRQSMLAIARLATVATSCQLVSLQRSRAAVVNRKPSCGTGPCFHAAGDRSLKCVISADTRAVHRTAQPPSVCIRVHLWLLPLPWRWVEYPVDVGILTPFAALPSARCLFRIETEHHSCRTLAPNQGFYPTTTAGS